MQQLAELVGGKACQKYKNPRDCFRDLDDDQDGMITRSECLRFMERLGFQGSVAEQVFGALREPQGDFEGINYNTFISTFGPFISPNYKGMMMDYSKYSARGGVMRQRPASAGPMGHGRPLTPFAVQGGPAAPAKAATAPIREANKEVTEAVVSGAEASGKANPRAVKPSEERRIPKPPNRPQSRQRPWARRAKAQQAPRRPQSSRPTRPDDSKEGHSHMGLKTCPHCSMPLAKEFDEVNNPARNGSKFRAKLHQRMTAKSVQIDEASTAGVDQKQSLASALEGCWSVL